jgi:hypothetical protein
MTLLNKGLRLTPGQIQIQLNNRVFETASGTAFVTLRPDAAKVGEVEDATEISILDPGSDTAGYLRVAIKYLDVGLPTAGYSFVITTLGDSPQVLETAKIEYGEEVTLGLSWDSAEGEVSYTVARADKTNISPVTKSLDAFDEVGIDPSITGYGVVPATEAPLSIHGEGYSGFFGKLATYSTVMSNSDLERYALDPANLPTTNRVLLLDATQLNAASRFDASVGETQTFTFGSANKSGVITIAGVTTAVLVGDSGEVIAEKVRASLAASSQFKQQLAKQKITFGAATDAGTLYVGGVDVSVSEDDGPTDVASAVKIKLEASSFIIDNPGRKIQDNEDGSLLITFRSADGNPTPISVDSGESGVTASVDTVQRYSASSSGPKLSVSGPNLSIEFSRADLDPVDLSYTNGATGVKIQSASSVDNHTLESRSFMPSDFTFAGTPVGEVQRYIVTEGATDPGTITVTWIDSNGATTEYKVDVDASGLTPSETAKIIADGLKTQAADDDNVLDVVAIGDTVEVRFAPSAGHVPLATVEMGDTGIDGIGQVVQRFAQNLQGESQTITFSGATSNTTLSVDGVTVPVTASTNTPATAAAIASAVQTALVKDGTQGNGRFSTPEIQMLTFLNGSADGSVTINGVTLAVDGMSTADIASEIADDLNNVASNNYFVEADGDAIRVIFDNAEGSSPPLWMASFTGDVSATSFSVVQEYNPNGIRATRVNSDGTLTIDFAPYEGNVDPVLFQSTGQAVSASVSTTREAHSALATSSSYSGGITNPSSAAPSNVIYAQLASSESGFSRTTKKVAFDVYIDKAVLTRASQIGTGYDAVDFTLKFPTTDFSAKSLVATPMASSAATPIINLSTPGQVVVRWLDIQSITDFSKPILKVSLDQLKSDGSFNSAPSLTLEKVSIDGVDFTDGTTYARSFSDTLNTDVWDIKQKLVSGLDGTTGIGGQLVGYYGSAYNAGGQLELKFNAMKDPGNANPTLNNTSKQLALDVVNSDITGVKTVKFAIELPSNATNASFVLSTAATAAGLKLVSTAGANAQVGRTLYVSLEGGSGSLARGATIGSVTTDLSSAFDRTHEFSFASGSVSYSNNSGTVSGSGNGIYFGYTVTDSTAARKGEWVAKDMPRGEFNKFLIDTALTNAAKAISAADALQILKLSAGLGLDWRPGLPVPVGAFAASDMDGNGKIQAADALIALKYATGTVPAIDPVKWKFYDGATVDLDDQNAKLQALKTGMQVTTTSDILEIGPSSEYFTRAILVGNLTNPALDA